MKVYVVAENRDGILESVVVYKNFDDARTYFNSCVEEDFVEIIVEPGNECLYARDNDDCDYEITVSPTELL